MAIPHPDKLMYANVKRNHEFRGKLQQASTLPKKIKVIEKETEWVRKVHTLAVDSCKRVQQIRQEEKNWR
jgi:hypothetical protein